MSKAENKPPGCDKKSKIKRPTVDLGIVKDIATLNVVTSHSQPVIVLLMITVT